ncbi:MAG: hypothetical protein IJA98_04755 [Bacteroidaceae bacterium]|nr:hypothetical protein [Bacteroidaceae bacterium]
MMKKKDLRGALLSEKGFCKNLSMKEFYKESVAWKIINDLGLQLTTKFPKDKDGKSFWQPLWELNQIRSRCIRISCCMSQESLESEFEGLVSSLPLMVKLQTAPLLAVQIVLTWSVLEFMRKPSSYVKRYKKAIELLLSCERLNQFNCEQEQSLLSIEEQTEYRRLYDWMYNVLLEIKSIIKKNKGQNIYIQINPELEVPQKISGSWAKPTNNFDLTRIGEILTLWKSKDEHIVVLKLIKNECGVSRVLTRVERMQKSASIDELIKALKDNDGIALLCHLQDLKMQNKEELEDLHDGIEQIKAENTSRNIEIEKKEKTIQMQAGHIAYLESSTNKKRKYSKAKEFRQCITFPEDAEFLIQKLHSLIDFQISPKDVFMPLRAAVDAGVIRRPTWEEFCMEFGETKVNSKSSHTTYFSIDYKYTDEAFNLLVQEFAAYRKRL